MTTDQRIFTVEIHKLVTTHAQGNILNNYYSMHANRYLLKDFTVRLEYNKNNRFLKKMSFDISFPIPRSPFTVFA